MLNYRLGTVNEKVTIKSVINKFYAFSHKNNDLNVLKLKDKCGGHLELIRMLNDTQTRICIIRCFKCE